MAEREAVTFVLLQLLDSTHGSTQAGRRCLYPAVMAEEDGEMDDILDVIWFIVKFSISCAVLLALFYSPLFLLEIWDKSRRSDDK